MKSTLRTAVIAAFLTAAPGIAAAECALGDAPQIPDGASATQEQMVAAQEAVKVYLAETQEFLSCLELSSRGRMDGDVTRRYNQATETMEKLASRFNTELRTFKNRG